jgi:hypothetical protein
MGLWVNYTSLSVMDETAEVQHAASLFLGLDNVLNKQSALQGYGGFSPCSTMLTEKLVSISLLVNECIDQ